MTRALLTRLKKLEAKRRTRRVHRPIIFACYADEGGGDVVGLALGQRIVNRLFTDQCMTAFAYRAASVLGALASCSRSTRSRNRPLPLTAL